MSHRVLRGATFFALYRSYNIYKARGKQRESSIIPNLKNAHFTHKFTLKNGSRLVFVAKRHR